MITAKGTVGSIAAQPLAKAAERDSYVVDRIVGPERRRLCEMGLVEGAVVSVLNRPQSDMMVIKVGGSRLALARGMGDRVLVK